LTRRLNIFIKRLRENRRFYKLLAEEHVPDIECRENIVGYNGRHAYVNASNASWRAGTALMPTCVWT
jgi:hypothetical protein